MEENNLDITQQPTQEAESLTPSPESVELSSPAQTVEATSEVNEVNTVAEKKKTTKDFTPEERKLIIKRAKRAGSVKAAREYNTTWQAIEAWIRAEAANKNAKSNHTRIKKKFTRKEIKAILAKADEVGEKQAAEQFGTTTSAIGGWKKAAMSAKQKAAQATTQKASKSSASSASPASPAKPKTAKKSTVNNQKQKAVTATAPKAPKAKSAGSSESKLSLELENAMLKERNAQLVQQVEKLKAMVADIAKMV